MDLFELKSWIDFTNEEKTQIQDLVETAGEVSKTGLLNRLKNTRAIVVCKIDDAVVACGAIKNPKPEYRKDKFESANSKLNCEDFNFEIGYLSVSAKHRRKGYGSKITNLLVTECNSQSVFATTRYENQGMQKILKCVGFESEGTSFKSKQGEYSLVLWIRKPLRL